MMPEHHQTSSSFRQSPPSGATPGTSSFRVRPFTEGDRPFFQSVVQRLHPGATASPRDAQAMTDYFRRLAAGEIAPPAGSEVFVAIDTTDRALGLISIHPGTDYFTGHSRAYVETLVVAAEAEGQGVGRVLMAHADDWARQRGMVEVSLDVFAENTGARAFYERSGYRVDHLRLTKRL